MDLDGKQHLASRGYCLVSCHLHCLWNVLDLWNACSLFFLVSIFVLPEISCDKLNGWLIASLMGSGLFLFDPALP